jgi:hypothetical protein
MALLPPTKQSAEESHRLHDLGQFSQPLLVEIAPGLEWVGQDQIDGNLFDGLLSWRAFGDLCQNRGAYIQA